MSGADDGDILAYFDTWVPRVEARLEHLLPAGDVEPAALHLAMRHSTLAGGKRLRPILVLLGARAAGGDESAVLDVACAVEMVHTYSLVHDDLPAMDDDDLRRGRPSCHKVFGEAVAILAGDALLTLAFEVTLSAAPGPERGAQMCVALAVAAGTRGMVGGQVADLEAEGRVARDGNHDGDLDLVRSVHRRKTAALLAACLEIGAVGAGGDADLRERLTGFGRRLGLAFQIVDDVLDEEGLSGELGKTPGKDRASGKLTYPRVMGVERSRREAGRLTDEALGFVVDLPVSGLLSGLVDVVLRRRA